MDIWKIDLNSDECQYTMGNISPADPKRCSHPESKTGECTVKENCPAVRKTRFGPVKLR